PPEQLVGQSLFVRFLRSTDGPEFFDLSEFAEDTKSAVKKAVKRKFYGAKDRPGIIDVNADGVIPASLNSHGHFCFYACHVNNASFRAMLASALRRLRSRDVFDAAFIDEVEKLFEAREAGSDRMMNGLVATDVALEAGLFE